MHDSGAFLCAASLLETLIVQCKSFPIGPLGIESFLHSSGHVSKIHCRFISDFVSDYTYTGRVNPGSYKNSFHTERPA